MKKLNLDQAELFLGFICSYFDMKYERSAMLCYLASDKKRSIENDFRIKYKIK